MAVPAAALETVGEATLSLITNTVQGRERRRFHKFKPNIMRCACVGDSGILIKQARERRAMMLMMHVMSCWREGVGKTTLLATLREGRCPQSGATPTVYEWFYFTYCLNSKSLIRQLDRQLLKADEPASDSGETTLDSTQKKDIAEVIDQLEEKQEESGQANKNNKKEITIEFLDTAGEFEGFRHLRPWHYKDVDVFLLAFDLTDRQTFLNIEKYWMEDIKTWSPSCLIILVGTKADLATEATDLDVTPENGSSMARSSSAPSLASASSASSLILSLMMPTRQDSPILLQRKANGGKACARHRQVKKEEAEQLAERIDAVTYLETSAVTELNLKCLLQLCVSQVFLLDDSPATLPPDAPDSSQLA